MPYRIELARPPAGAAEILIELGALDVEVEEGRLAALMPDGVSAEDVAAALGLPAVPVSAAVGRDDDSVWTLSLKRFQIGSLAIVPATEAAPTGALRIADAPAFGTGLHATTGLCLDLIHDVCHERVERLLDVGTGSGILALAALRRGVQHAVGLDIDPRALAAAQANARLNGLAERVSFVRGGPDALRGCWPVVVANIRAAELMAMAGTLVRRAASRGHLILSGIPRGVAEDVERTYQRLGMVPVRRATRDGWTALLLRSSW